MVKMAKNAVLVNRVPLAYIPLLGSMEIKGVQGSVSSSGSAEKSSVSSSQLLLFVLLRIANHSYGEQRSLKLWPEHTNVIFPPRSLFQLLMRWSVKGVFASPYKSMYRHQIIKSSFRWDGGQARLWLCSVDYQPTRVTRLKPIHSS